MKTIHADGVLSLGLANGVSLLAAVGAVAAYASWLQPAEFTHWTAALAIARAGLLLLDGGLKTALVRRAAWPAPSTLRHLQLLCLALAVALVAAGGVTAGWFWFTARLQSGEAWLYAAYLAAYLLPYPPLFGALARLERAQSFGVVGRAEGLSVVLEFSLPAVLMLFGMPYWLAFATAVFIARIVRSVWIVVGVDADVAVGAEFGEYGVGDGAAGGEVQVAGLGSGFVAGVDGCEACGVGVVRGEVDRHGAGIGRHAPSSGDSKGGRRSGGDFAGSLVLAVDGGYANDGR